MLVSHCVLNQNAVVRPLARARGALTAAVEAVIRSGCGIVQLPCPEMAFGGLTRPPMTRAEYDSPEYRALCTEMVDQVIASVKPMLDDGGRIVGVLAIHGSPSCSVAVPYGHFMAELLGRPELAGTPMLGVPEDCCVEPDSRYSDDARFSAHPNFWPDLDRILHG